MDLGIPAINTLNKSGVLGTKATSIQRPRDVSHCSRPDNIFGEATSAGMSAAKLDHDYSYKTYFEIWRENREFEHQKNSMSQPPLESTPIVTNTINVTTSHLDSTTIGTNITYPKPLTGLTYS